jgi:hypothetical protein
VLPWSSNETEMSEGRRDRASVAVKSFYLRKM